MRNKGARGLFAGLSGAVLLGMCLVAGARQPAPKLPWARAGLTERQAAVHLLDRFAFGPRPGDVDRVVAQGLDLWFEQQLGGAIADPDLEHKLQRYKSLTLPAEEMIKTYPPPTLVLREAREAGVVGEQERDLENPELRRKLRAFGQEKGYRPLRELLTEMEAQKVVRGIYSRNQLTEVLTDFWFNHFNVSTTDNQARPYVLAYERDAIRPHILGRFRELLGATAHHPAMLFYLDNAQSSAAADSTTSLDMALSGRPAARRRMGERKEAEARSAENGEGNEPRPQRRGINENYARELLELHTLGVDGGYTQDDVIAVARAFTGWTVFPPGPRGEKLERRIERGRRLGFYREGLFLFRPDTHDAGAKTVLGEQLPVGGNMEEGERVLDIVSRRPQTARRIARKLAVRFVSDNPPAALLDRLSNVFLQTGGDLKAVVRTIAESPEFWAPEARRAKIKSPLELVVSALRATDARLQRPQEVVEWIGRLGEPLYACQPPTGYPDRAEAWVNTGALLGRMNFGLQLGTGEVFGVRTNLLELNQGHEPESLEAAFKTYAAILMPERDVANLLRQLVPVAQTPGLAAKIRAEAEGAGQQGDRSSSSGSAVKRGNQTGLENDDDMVDLSSGETAISSGDVSTQAREPASTPLALVVGVILGSPEFQRH